MPEIDPIPDTQQPVSKKSRFSGPSAPGLFALALTSSFLFLPLIGELAIFILPAPVAFQRSRYGTGPASFTSAICVALVAGAAGVSGITLSVAGLCLVGLVVGDSMQKGEPFDVAVFKGAIGPVIICALLAGAYFLIKGQDPWALLYSGMDKSVTQAVDIYRRMGISQADIDNMLPTMRLVTRVVRDYLPAIVVCGAAMTSFVNAILTARYARRVGVSGWPSKPPSAWTVPDHVVWGVVASGFLMLPDITELRLVSGNFLAVFAVVYFFQGMAVIETLFDRLKLGRVFRVVSYVVALTQPYIVAMLAVLGLADMWADFRKIRPAGQKPGKDVPG